jgi:hypothetical protein
MRERRKSIAKQRQVRLTYYYHYARLIHIQDAQEMKDWFARRKRERMTEQTQQE